MRILSTYIATHLLKTIAVVMLALVGISTFFEFINEVKYLSRDHVTLMDIVMVVLLAIPESTYTIFATAVFIGSLMALGGLSSKSELVAMQAVTLSKQKIAVVVVFTGILLMAIMVLLGEFVLPRTQTEREQLSSKIKSNVVVKQLQNVWVKEDNYFIQFGNVRSDNEMSQIKVYVLANNRIATIYEAASATQRDSIWRLFEIKQSDFVSDQVNIRYIPQMDFPWQFDRSMIYTLGANSQNLSLRAIAQYITYFDVNQIDGSQYELAFWVKLFAPLSVLVMLVLALPFAFGSHRAGNTGNMLVTGLVLGLLYYVLSGILTNLGQLYGLTPILSALTPPMLFLCLAMFLIMRQKY